MWLTGRERKGLLGALRGRRRLEKSAQLRSRGRAAARCNVGLGASGGRGLGCA